MTIDLSGRVAVVTGAGGGLGREHALLLARRGAKVVVNDVGGSVAGTGASATAAQAVVSEIRAAGGEAIANASSVTDYAAVEAMIEQARSLWGKVDILVNNAGILRDKSFSKMSLEDFRSVMDVHLMGSVHCTRAVWNYMREQSFGRIVMTTSSSGLFGNFGQANYGAAKLALVGLMQTLALEGAKYNIRVNCIAPSAGTRMLDGLMSDEMLNLLPPAAVSPGVLALVADDAPSRTILCAGGGSYELAHITLTRGIYVGTDEHSAERVAENWGAIGDRAGEIIPAAGILQSQIEIEKCRASADGSAQEHNRVGLNHAATRGPWPTP
jgi:NAD(P)-dependent dehydrogenase (short-subunit alcohol dehydrogenase family)